jgi:hypothetical protein
MVRVMVMVMVMVLMILMVMVMMMRDDRRKNMVVLYVQCGEGLKTK